MATRLKKEEKNEKLIRALSKLNENKKCINCNALVPQYVCTNFWTFVCLTCSGIHREFTHRVKSISMSKFSTAEVNALHSGGNERAREIYLKNWDFQNNGLPDSNNVERLRTFIKQVYVERRYVAEGFIQRNRAEEYGRFSLDCRYPEDMLDTGRLSLSSYQSNNSAGDGMGRLSNCRGNNDEIETGSRLSNYQGAQESGSVRRSSSYTGSDIFESIRHPSNYRDYDGGDGMRRLSNYSMNADVEDTRRLSNCRGNTDGDNAGRQCNYNGNADGGQSNYSGNEAFDGHRRLSNYYRNDGGDIMRCLPNYHGNNEGDSVKLTFHYKGLYGDTTTRKHNQISETHMLNNHGNQHGQNILQFAAPESFSQRPQRAENCGLQGREGKNMHISKFASFSNGAQVDHDLSIFRRANSDSLIDLGSDGAQSNLFGIQGSSSVDEKWVRSTNEGWATFDTHPPSPPRPVATAGRNLINMAEINEKHTSEAEVLALPMFDISHSTLHFGNGSLNSEPSHQPPFSKEIAEKWNPFPSTASLIEGSHQLGSRWEPYNTSITANATTDLSDRDHKQHVKESCSSSVQHRKSKNPFDLPDDYVPSSSSSINAQFPTMDALHMALPVSSSYPSSLLAGYSSATAAEYFGQTLRASLPLETASLEPAIENCNPGALYVGTAIAANFGLQVPVQGPGQPFRSSNPFD